MSGRPHGRTRGLGKEWQEAETGIDVARKEGGSKVCLPWQLGKRIQEGEGKSK